MNSRTNKGITLIALVITIIILLILAGVTINMVLGNDGIIAQTQQAKQLNKDAAIQEQIDLLRAEVKMAEHGLGNVAWLDEDIDKGKTRADNVIKWLEGKELVDESELEKKNLQTIGYIDNSKTFSLNEIVKWESSPESYFSMENGVLLKECLVNPNNVASEEDYMIDIVIPYGVTTIGETRSKTVI